MQRNEKKFKNQTIYIGIDVHKKSWEVYCLTESGYGVRHSQHAGSEELLAYLCRKFPGGRYLAVYESGFTGFSTYYSLYRCGIECIVTHAGDVPTTTYQEVMKSDRVDAEKLARTLKAGLLRPIRIHPEDRLDDRSVVRLRRRTQEDLSRHKVRIKFHLHSNGVDIPPEYNTKGRQWSREFVDWLRHGVSLPGKSRVALDLLISQYESCREQLRLCEKETVRLSRTERYSSSYSLLRTIPGVGHKVCMTLLTEIPDFSVFPNEKCFASYVGLVPMRRSSGEKDPDCAMTFRGSKHLCPMFIEAGWVAVSRSPSLSADYVRYCQRMKRQQAIVRIARKLANIVFAVMKNGVEYEE